MKAHQLPISAIIPFPIPNLQVAHPQLSAILPAVRTAPFADHLKSKHIPRAAVINATRLQLLMAASAVAFLKQMARERFTRLCAAADTLVLSDGFGIYVGRARRIMGFEGILVMNVSVCLQVGIRLIILKRWCR